METIGTVWKRLMNNWKRNWNLINETSRWKRRSETSKEKPFHPRSTDTNEVSNVESVKLIKVTQSRRKKKEENMCGGRRENVSV